MDYERLKSLIPAHHLVEIRYEDFEADPLEGLRNIYARLGLEGFEQSIPAFTAYFNSQRKFEKASHQFTPEETERITSRWRFAMEMYGYAMPEQMSVK